MARKTNKTSHVLNLITNGAPAEPEAKTAEETGAESPEAPGHPDTSEESFAGEVGAVPSGGTSVQPAAQAPSQPAPSVTGQMTDKKVIVVDDSDSDKISNEIRERLEEHLEQSILQAAAEEPEEAGSGSEVLETELDDGIEERAVSRPEDEAKEEAKAQPEGEAEPEDSASLEGQSGEAAEIHEEGRDPEELAQPAAEEEQDETVRGAREEPGSEIAAPNAAADEEDAEEPSNEDPAYGKESEESAGQAEESTEAPESQGVSVPDGAERTDSPPVQEKEYHMLNVVEKVLGRINLKEEMKKYDVCTCSRCCADVMALCLTCLPPKYVVVDDTPTAPLIGYYESRNRARIIMEIVKACLLVKEKPRHKEYEIIGDALR